MGAINSLAGAAGAIGLVGLESAAGLDPVAANASLRLSALVIGLTGYAAYRSRGHHIPTQAWRYGLMTVPGGVAGAVMAVTLPVWVLRAILLVVLATVLWQQLAGARRGGSTAPRRTPDWLRPLAFFLVGVHMGFVQVGVGLVSIAVLTAVHSRDLVEVNAAKMAIVICSSIAANAVLLASGEIVWPPAIALAIGCGAGSFVAIRWSIDRGHAAVRVVVLTITTGVLLRLLWQLVEG